jgi:glycosyltransferase involved in cell wall biosynthesis
MTSPLWSILIPGVPARIFEAQVLMRGIEQQADKAGALKDVQIIYLLDNKTMTVGTKRNLLLAAADGEYLSFIDDDDQVAGEYVGCIMAVLKGTRSAMPDVVTFRQEARLVQERQTHHCTYGLEYLSRPETRRRQLVPRLDEMMQPTGESDWTGPPAHTMVWRSALAKSETFPAENFGEDVAWCDRVGLKAKTEQRVDKVLYIYVMDSRKSETRAPR